MSLNSSHFLVELLGFDLSVAGDDFLEQFDTADIASAVAAAEWAPAVVQRMAAPGGVDVSAVKTPEVPEHHSEPPLPPPSDQPPVQAGATDNLKLRYKLHQVTSRYLRCLYPSISIYILYYIVA